MNTATRRDILTVGGGLLATAGLSGCLGTTTDNPDSASETPSVFTSFFTLYDFTRNVGGEALSIENAVPAGEHGHGWEPPIDVLPDIVESDAFVYLDADGFQPWAERAAAEIEENYADDVQLIDVLDGIDVLEYDSSHHEEYDHDSTDLEYGSVAEVELLDRRTDDVVAHFHFDHWHGAIPDIRVDSSLSLGARVTDASGNQFPLGADQPYEIAAELPHGASDDVITITSNGDHVQFTGDSAGSTHVLFRLIHDDDLEWESEPLSATVVTGDEHDPNREHGLYDVKFFSDPVLAQTGVRTIRDGLLEFDPGNEDVYTENAAAYTEQLDDLHHRYRDELADRTHDLVVLAGHDSFHYLSKRYGFEINTPVGLSPDDEPSSTDIARAVDLVEEHDLEYVLWDYFDGDRTANAIVSEAESARGAEKVSAGESYVPDWKEDGYGDYIGQMERINLPAFEKALGAE